MPQRVKRPIESIEDILGLLGQYDAEVARLLKVHPSTVGNWRRLRCIGRENWDVLIEETRKRGHKIDANLLHRVTKFPGRDGSPKRGRPPVRYEPPTPEEAAPPPV